MSPRNATPSLNTIREGLHLNPLVNIQIFQAINCPKTTFFELTQVSRWEESFLTFWFLKSTVSWADFIAALLQTWKDYKFVNFWGPLLQLIVSDDAPFGSAIGAIDWVYVGLILGLTAAHRSLVTSATRGRRVASIDILLSFCLRYLIKSLMNRFINYEVSISNRNSCAGITVSEPP